MFAAVALACLTVARAETTLEESHFATAIATAEGMPRLRSLLISHRGELIIEQYLNGARASRTNNVKSVSKTIMSALIGIAIGEGLIEGVDQPVEAFLPDYFEDIDDPRKREITVGNLMSMQAGLETTSFYNYGAWVTSSDWVRYAVDQPMLARPGTRLLYSTGNTHLLSVILTRASEESAFAFAERNLTRPLGFELAAWDRAPDGVYFGGNNMAFTPRQMLAFGEMYLDGGRYNGRQVVPEDWVELSLTPRVESPRERGRYYGYGWWMRYSAGFLTPYAWGYGGQFILLAPELDLVAVATSNSEPGSDRRSHIRALYRMLEYGVVAAAADALGEYRPAARPPLRVQGSSGSR